MKDKPTEVNEASKWVDQIDLVWSIACEYDEIK